MTTNSDQPQTVMTEGNAERKLAGFNIYKANELKDAAAGFFFVLYGQGGAGKTTLAADAALLGPTLHLDMEGGADAISHRDDVDVVPLYTWRDFEKMTDHLKKGDHGYTNIIVDNLVELVDMRLRSIAGNTDNIEIQEWGQMSRDVKYKTREYRDAIARKQGVNVFFLVWDADEKDDRGTIKKDLAFSPSLRKEFPGIVTIIGHVAVTNDPNRRMLNFAPGPKTVSKFRRSADSAAQEVPFNIYYGINNLPMADVIRTMKGELKKWPTSKYPAPERGTIRRSGAATTEDNTESTDA